MVSGLALCAGIAGLELGLHLALDDYQTVCAVEWDAYAQRILIARQDDGSLAPFPIWDDVTTFDGTEWRGKVDILSAGYPCQPFSLAGNRQGVDDPRHLWPHVARIIGECQPALVFLENVPGHLSLGFSDVGLELCALGYGFEAGLFSAAEVGASQERERLFVLAHAEGRGSQRLDIPGERRRTVLDACGSGEVMGLPSLWPPFRKCHSGWEYVLEGNAALAPAIDTPFESGVRVVAPGLPRRVDQLYALGNAVVPLVAAHAFRTLATRLEAANR